MNYSYPKLISGKEISILRQQLGITQAELAEFLNVSKRTVEHWEISQAVKGVIIPMLYILKNNPSIYWDYQIPEKKCNLRLKYMEKDYICTIIDVDTTLQKIYIKNFVKDPICRAFGVNTEPTWEDYEHFLESRCFPQTRDKIKIILEQLNLPFYDPMMIIEKTGGRMADDEFYIEIERS